jgi:hypothetical protein
MKNVTIKLGLPLLAFCLASPVLAADWWMVYAEGASPDRKMVYLNLESAYEQRNLGSLGPIDLSKPDPLSLPPIVRIDGTNVYESAAMPAKVTTRYFVDCTKKTVSSEPYSLLWRDDRTETKPGLPPTLASTNVALNQIVTFVCNKRQRERNAVQVTDDYEPMEITWATFWKDAAQPAWTSTRTPEEINASIDQTLAETNAMLSSAVQIAGAQLQRQEIDRDATILNQRRMLAKAQNRGTPLLQTWVGRTEEELVRAWGVPAGSHNSGSSRFLSYAYGFSEVLVDQNGFSRPNRTLRCDLTLEVKEGRIVDFASSGNYCGTAAASLPKGRS